MNSRSTAALLLTCTAFASLAGCGGAPDPTEDELRAPRALELTAGDAVARAQLWVNAQVPYCQSPNGKPDADPACASVCTRPVNPDWDPYRSDCSGFVSWAWGLAAPGHSTDQFAPAKTDITAVIDGNSLQPGDALNIPGDHMIFFVAWITAGSHATFMEEPGCSASPNYAHEFSSAVVINGSSVTVAYEGKTFTAIRYQGLSASADAGTSTSPDAGTSCVVRTTNTPGVCISTSACQALGDHTSTPGYCPGAANIECCTPIPCPDSSHCAASTPVCDSSTGGCRACNADGECATGVCALAPADPKHGQCVQCVSDDQCPFMSYCNVSSDRCAACTAGNPACPSSLNDAGVQISDAGAQVSDAGAQVSDAGSPDEDAGSPHEDAGTGSEDAGTQLHPGTAGGCASGGGDLALFGILVGFLFRFRRRAERV